jgi:exodeoxyribonuclease VII small subunit
MNLTYSKIYANLSKLVDQIEGDKIQVDTLADKIKEAKELIVLCESKLRKIETEVKVALTGKTPTMRKRKRS